VEKLEQLSDFDSKQQVSSEAFSKIEENILGQTKKFVNSYGSLTKAGVPMFTERIYLAYLKQEVFK